MSVQVNQYLLFGIKLDYNQYQDDYEKFEPYEDDAFKKDDIPPGRLLALFDGMCGKYIYVGRCLKKTGNYGHLPNMVLEDLISDEEKEQVRQQLLDELGLGGKLQLHLITHQR